MKVKVGNKIYDGANEPVMVILTDNDKDMIGRMDPGDYRYCCYPYKKYDRSLIEKWMKEGE